MKKLLVFLFLCIALIGYIKRNHRDKVDVLLLNNIEAIAGGENPDGVTCAGVGSVDCPISSVKVKNVFGGYRFEIQ